MKLLWIAPQAFYSARGTPMNVRRLAEAIAGAGHSIDLVTYGFGVDVPMPQCVRIVRAGKLPFVDGVPIGPSLAKALLDVRVLAAARRLLAAESSRYDAMQGFEEGAWIAALLSRWFAVPFVYDMDSDIEAQLRSLPLLRPFLPVARAIDRTAVRRAIAVLTVCRTLTERVHEVAPAKPVFQIEDAPNVAAFASHEAARAELVARLRLGAGPLVVYTGNLERYQGVDLLVRAVPRIAAERADVTVLIVGGNDRQVRAMRALAASLGVEHAIRLLGARPEQEMATFLAGADVLVSPRSRGTNTPLKLYAYLLSGRPVVVTDRPVHTQLVSDAEAALADATPEGIADATLRLLRDPASAAAIAANAERLVREKYSAEAFSEKARAFANAVESLLRGAA